MLPLTPFQTVGPFFAILVPEQGRLSLAGADVPGERIVIDGTVRDGAGQPVPDALIEIWQANAAGCCNHPDDARTAGPDTAFDGFGRVHTDGAGGFSLKTIKPGPVPGPDGQPQAPHLLVGLFARGLLSRLVTRIYFSDEPANGDDPILAAVAPDRRPTLVAARRDDGSYTHTITLQGPGETVFFDV
ncbi:MAG: protocatechuate 3,4-dioxygenase subunit alpha [Acidobacteria bacterium]|nr:protocatechuate 3,4-dioxygenase subunit alpha [Acidobacteriota bacterium]